MLNEHDVEEIEREAKLYENKRGACIDALKIVQRRHGWVSDEHLRDIAVLLDMSVDDLDGVATFYNLIYRRPVGRHVVHVCDSVSCWLMGTQAVSARLATQFGAAHGETTSDGRFTVLPIPCLGACDEAPAMLVDGTLHTRVDPDALTALLAQYP
jgi:NADH-quinone oxidoreductase subunit E